MNKAILVFIRKLAGVDLLEIGLGVNAQADSISTSFSLAESSTPPSASAADTGL